MTLRNSNQICLTPLTGEKVQGHVDGQLSAFKKTVSIYVLYLYLYKKLIYIQYMRNVYFPVFLKIIHIFLKIFWLFYFIYMLYL